MSASVPAIDEISTLKAENDADKAELRALEAVEAPTKKETKRIDYLQTMIPTRTQDITALRNQQTSK